ncbi:MAG TPA: AraC family transcriptional regulator, partial [Phycisphaerae bacterium]|nr:AraC family transcriptional regulator [Phycisphaerae bacterium]
MSVLWNVPFSVSQPLAAFPRPWVLARESRGSDYYCEGRFRTGATHLAFQYTLSGRGIFRDAAGEHQVVSGSGFLCEISDIDTAYYYPDDCDQPWEFFWFCFDGQGAHDMVRDMLERFGPIYHLPHDKGVVSRLLAYAVHSQAGVDMTPSQGAQLVMDVLMAMAAANEPLIEEDPGNELICRARAEIRANLDRDINVTDLARLLQVSREHLTRVFHKISGTTPHRYLIRQKMLLACRLLKDTSLSIKEVSARLGYDSPAHFTRTFRGVL